MAAEPLSCRLLVTERDLDVELDVAAGVTLALLGANGSGKSSVLEGIAGLLRPNQGSVRLGRRALCDSEARIEVPVHARQIGLLAQQPALVPHLNVAANVAFGPRARGLSRVHARQVAYAWLDRVGVADLALRRPAQLSGGQAQRVALARMLASEPRLLLFDEPLSALDVDVAAQLRVLLAEVIREHTAIVVTHDVIDVVALADEVAVLSGGRVVERGNTADVLVAPRSEFAASVAGVNLIRGTSDTGPCLVSEGVRVFTTAATVPPGAAAVAVFRPEAVTIHRNRPEGSARNTWQVRVSELRPLAHGVRVLARPVAAPDTTVAADITAVAASELDCRPGQERWFAIKAHEVGIHPA